MYTQTAVYYKYFNTECRQSINSNFWDAGVKWGLIIHTLMCLSLLKWNATRHKNQAMWGMFLQRKYSRYIKMVKRRIIFWMAHNYFFHGMQHDKSLKFISKRGRKFVTHINSKTWYTCSTFVEVVSWLCPVGLLGHRSNDPNYIDT